jgi:hypothetical protein
VDPTSSRQGIGDKNVQCLPDYQRAYQRNLKKHKVRAVARF